MIRTVCLVRPLFQHCQKSTRRLVVTLPIEDDMHNTEITPPSSCPHASSHLTQTQIDITQTVTADDTLPHHSSQQPPTGGCPYHHVQQESEEALDAAKPFTDIPGPRGVPLLGNALKYSKLGPYKFEKIVSNRLAYQKKYGNIYREKLGAMDMVHIFDPSDIAKMFHLEGKYPSRGTIANLELTYLKRNKKLVGFAFLDGPEWARQRGIIQKVMMHPNAAARYLHMQIPVVKDFVDYLGTKREEDDVVPDLYENLFKYTMEAIGIVCFNERLGTFSENNNNLDARRLANAISETFYCFRNCMFAVPWYQYFKTPMYRRFERAADTAREIMGKHVEKIAAKIQQGADADQGLCPFIVSLMKEDRSMFEVLMQDNRVTSELAVNLIMALFRTGIDSTGNALAFFLYNLSQNPDKQALVYEEIKTVLPNDESLYADALAKMPYLKAALRESFRLNFPVFGGSGRVMPEDVVFSGYKVPKGKFIFANLAAMSLMEDYFPKPEEFHPERWLRDHRTNLQTSWTKDSGYISLPFSHGMRACPGKRFAEQGLYLAAVSILQRFELRYRDEDKVGMIHMPFTIPDKPLQIQFIERNSNK